MGTRRKVAAFGGATLLTAGLLTTASGAIAADGPVQMAFIGMTLEGTDSLVSQDGIEGYSFLDEVETANALVPEIQA